MNGSAVRHRVLRPLMFTALGVLVVLLAGPGAARVRAATAATPTCPRSALSIRSAGDSQASSMLLSEYELINTSQRACQLVGGPRVIAYDIHGHRLGLRSLWQTFGSPRPVRLTPRGHAYVGVFSVVSGFARGACDKTGALDIIPPGDAGGFTVHRRLIFCQNRLSVTVVTPTRRVDTLA